MSVSPLTPLVNAVGLTTDWVDIYLAPAEVIRAGIEAATFNNYSAANVAYSVRILNSGFTGLFNELITDKTIRPGDNDLALGIVGQAVLSGGVIQAKCSVNNSVSVNITGALINND